MDVACRSEAFIRWCRSDPTTRDRSASRLCAPDPQRRRLDGTMFETAKLPRGVPGTPGYRMPYARSPQAQSPTGTGTHPGRIATTRVMSGITLQYGRLLRPGARSLLAPLKPGY